MLGLLSTKDGSSSMNRRRILEIICMAEDSEFMSYFPEWKEMHDEVKSKFEKYISWVEKEMKEIKNTEIWKQIESKNSESTAEERLEFFKLISNKSEDIKKLSWLFLRDPNLTVREALSKQDPKKLESILYKMK